MIYFRDVLNDVVVGPWQELKDWRGLQNWEGLKDWMDAEGCGWDYNQLECRGFDNRVMDYGSRLQFKVADREVGILEIGDEVAL